jgi:hypothetical protein
MTLLRVLRMRRPRLRLTLLVLLALVLQQAAFAAHACSVSEMPPHPVEMAECEGMDMPEPDAGGLCELHCSRDHATNPDLKAPQVPPLGLPLQRFTRVAALLPPADAEHYEDVPPCRSDPPPAQRFCSLQI